MRNSNFIFLLILIITSKFLASQEIPQEFYEFKLNELKYDFDDNWERNSTFGPIRFQDTDDFIFSENDSLLITTRYGLQSINENLSVFGYGNLNYSKYFYGYIF